MAIKEISGNCSFEIDNETEDTILRGNCENCNRLPTIEENPLCMSRTIEKLAQNPKVTKIVFTQKRDYEYDFDQTRILIEIALLYNKYVRDKESFSYANLSFLPSSRLTDQWYNEINHLLFDNLKKDPLGTYVELTRLIRREKILLDKTVLIQEQNARKKYVEVLEKLSEDLSKTKLLIISEPYIAGYNPEVRDVYRRIFNPLIKPDFMYTKVMAQYPKGGEEIDNYTIGDNTEITIFRLPNSIKTKYHMVPPEFKLSEEKYEVLDLARNILAEHKPKKSEFVDPRRMREVFFNVGKDLIEELSNYRNLRFRDEELVELTQILVRYTVGFGLIELLLQDDEMQDISVNSPLGNLPIFIVHGKHGDCETNIIPTQAEAESWASKLRMISGRPFDEADPLLDTELELPGASVRISAITSPLNPSGIAYSFRKHRERPWTLPLFITNKTITSLAAGLLSFLIDGTRTFFIAGTRSSGKTSLLSSMMTELMRRYRVITVEDTLELPVNSLKNLGYNIVSMKVASALQSGSSEFSATDGVRSTLRLGDSSIFVGEVRSKEAIAVFEAMRVGAGANVVGGTFHADSTYGVYDRCVNAIGIPKTSFKALDICIIVNPIKSADGLHSIRRVTSITEVRKDWEEDPLREGGFVDLMKYDVKKDRLEPTDALLNGESDVLKNVAANISDFAGNWDAVWQNIILRSKIKETLINYYEKEKDGELLEAEFVIKCNDKMHLIIDEVKNVYGKIDEKRVLDDFVNWIEEEIALRKTELNKTL
ncbi:type II/IV secretion system ATPase subunit [Candidatus Woesearchaeota archaeon]|nr:type II/IV secretion system ATPase subunit [Candidatus Woesearchaeota archaeon]